MGFPLKPSKKGSVSYFEKPLRRLGSSVPISMGAEGIQPRPPRTLGMVAKSRHPWLINHDAFVGMLRCIEKLDLGSLRWSDFWIWPPSTGQPLQLEL